MVLDGLERTGSRRQLPVGSRLRRSATGVWASLRLLKPPFLGLTATLYLHLATALMSGLRVTCVRVVKALHGSSKIRKF